MKWHLLLLSFLLFPRLLFGQNDCKTDGSDCACPKTGWCKVWPQPGYTSKPSWMHSNGWATLIPDSNHKQFYFFGEDNGLVTFANAWWAMPWKDWTKVRKPTSESELWTFLTYCGTGTLTPYVIHNQNITLSHAIDQAASVIELSPGQNRLAGKFSQEGTIVLQDPSGEAVHYERCDQADDRDNVVTTASCPGGSQRLILRNLTRGYLSNAGYNASGQPHASGTVAHDACPVPINMNGPIVGHPSDQHPVRDSAYDSKRKRVWHFGGYHESYSLRETWYLPTEGKDAFKWFRFLTPTLQSGNAESGGIYDPEHDVILRYGGIYTPTELWMLCFTKNTVLGCNNADDWNKVTGTKGSFAGARNGYSLVWDSKADRVLIYGGDRYNPNANQVYAYEVGTKTWTQLGPASGTVAPQQKFPPIAFDAKRGLQGSLTLYAVEGALYQFDIATRVWTKRSDIPSAPPTGPGPCEIPNGCYLAYDAVDDQYIYFGQSGVPRIWVLPGATLSTASKAE
jgi:hypothetical protein